MKIIIVGCGKVGYTIAKHLSEDNNDIVVIDKKPDAFDKISESLDVMVIKGNGLSTKTLNEVSVKTADLIICVTSSDETNILCCLTAKRLGATYAIARVRDPEYALELYRFKNDLGLDMIINPEQQAALEISQLLRFPIAYDIVTFVGGRVELVAHKVTKNDMLVGRPLSDIFKKNKFSLLVAIIERGGEAIIPNGDMIIQENDLIRVLGRPSDIMGFFRHLGLSTAKTKEAMIIGGGKVAYYLANLLEKSKIKLKIVEIDKEKCEELSESLPFCTVIQGDGTDEEILNSEKIKEAGAVVCLTDRDEENVVVALYANQWGVPKIIIKVTHVDVNLIKNLGLGSVICPKNITAYQIIQYVRGLKNSIGNSAIQTMYKIVDTDTDCIEALEFNVNSSSKFLNVPLRDLPIEKGNLIGCVVRRGSITIANGDTTIREGDSVIVITKNPNIIDLDSLLPASGGNV